MQDLTGRKFGEWHSKSKSYISWFSMMKRCTDPTSDSYFEYGGKGITVCKRWKDNFFNFLEDMGERPKGKSIDRIDNYKGYYKENCRWATAIEQANNRRTTLLIGTIYADTWQLVAKINKTTRSLFKCIYCGKVWQTNTNYVTKGRAASCKCYRKSKKYISRLEDLTGREFGDLTVVQRTNNDSNNNSLWICKCKCGDFRKVRGADLHRGRVTKCKECNKSNRFKDLTGQRFDKLLVIKRVDARKGNCNRVLWVCICDCGRKVMARGADLLSGRTRKCLSCFKNENFSHKGLTMSYPGAYNSWRDANKRCNNPQNPFYSNYGGRGIIICERWKRSNPVGFYNFCQDMGEKPEGKSLDRIDNNGPYSKENCKWSNSKEQSYNRRTTLVLGKVYNDCWKLKERLFDRTRAIFECVKCEKKEIKRTYYVTSGKASKCKCI